MPPTPATTVCCYLRWRSLDAGEPESRTPYADEGHFVCTHTLGTVGPDERVADEEACLEGRGCYQLPDQPPRRGETAREVPVAGESRRR